MLVKSPLLLIKRAKRSMKSVNTKIKYEWLNMGTLIILSCISETASHAG